MNTALPITIFLASLLGSVHCAGMCGTFALMAGGASRGDWRTAAAYNLGRLFTYILLGLIAGSLGAAVQETGSLLGWQHAAAIVAGILMILMGLAGLIRLSGALKSFRHFSFPGAHRWITSGTRLALTLSPVRRAALIGMLTTLLPCGWLYAFAVVAAGTAHPISAAALMAIFWTGTLPMMTLIGAGSQRLLGPLAARLPIATSALLLIMGLASVAGRLSIDTAAFAHIHNPLTTSATPPCCEVKHGH